MSFLRPGLPRRVCLRPEGRESVGPGRGTGKEHRQRVRAGEGGGVATDAETPAAPKPGRSVYAEYIAEQIQRQEERKKSIEARGVTVITTSGTLATLLLGLAALTTKEQTTFTLPTAAQDPLEWALIAFAAAALASIFTQLPMRYEEASAEGLRGLVDTSWNDSEEEALDAVARNRLTVLKRAKHVNGLKAWALFAAVSGEALAVIALAVAMTRLF